MPKKVHIGCGQKVLKDWINVDILDYGQQVVAEAREYLRKTKPYTLSEVKAEHFIEHFTVDEIKEIFKLVYNALEKNGIFKVVVPHKDRQSAWVLSHKTFFNERTFTILAEPDFQKTYGYDAWSVERLITNNRKDIHVWLKK